MKIKHSSTVNILKLTIQNVFKMATINIFTRILLVLTIAVLTKGQESNQINNFVEIDSYGKFWIFLIFKMIMISFFYVVFSNEHGSSFRKTYYLSKERVSWIYAGSGCHAAGLKFLSLDTKTEENNFFTMFNNKKSQLDILIHIGGQVKANGKNDNWVWAESGKNISYQMQFRRGEPNYPGVENCLAVDQDGFYDINCCSERWRQKYFCQKETQLQDVENYSRDETLSKPLDETQTIVLS